MSDEVDFYDYGLHSVALGSEAWFPLYNHDFDTNHWQRISVFPRLARTASGLGWAVPVKFTIVEEDWEIDESRTPVCWVLIRNLSPNYAAQFSISAIITPNR
jgi:hypothetical protein